MFAHRPQYRVGKLYYIVGNTMSVNTTSSKPKPQASLTEGQIKQTVNFLNHSFKDACETYKRSSGDNKNVKGTFLHTAQVEYSYLINEIQKGPIFFAIQNIATANEHIANVAGQLTKPE